MSEIATMTTRYIFVLYAKAEQRVRVSWVPKEVLTVAELVIHRVNMLSHDPYHCDKYQNTGSVPDDADKTLIKRMCNMSFITPSFPLSLLENGEAIMIMPHPNGYSTLDFHKAIDARPNVKYVAQIRICKATSDPEIFSDHHVVTGCDTCDENDDDMKALSVPVMVNMSLKTALMEDDRFNKALLSSNEYNATCAKLIDDQPVAKRHYVDQSVLMAKMHFNEHLSTMVFSLGLSIEEFLYDAHVALYGGRGTRCNDTLLELSRTGLLPMRNMDVDRTIQAFDMAAFKCGPRTVYDYGSLCTDWTRTNMHAVVRACQDRFCPMMSDDEYRGVCTICFRNLVELMAIPCGHTVCSECTVNVIQMRVKHVKPSTPLGQCVHCRTEMSSMVRLHIIRTVTN